VESMETIYAQYWPLVYRFLLGLCRSEHLAEELCQETFFKAMKHAGSFDESRKLTTWLCQIAKNTYYDHCRKQARRQRISGQEFREEPVQPGPEQSLETEEQQLKLLKKIHALPETAREVVYLRVFGGLGFAQIARVTGRTENWTRVTFYRAKQKLQNDKEKMQE